MRIAVVGICQVQGISDSLIHLLPGAEVFPLEAAVVRHAGVIDEAAALIDSCDVVMTHPTSPDFGPLGTDALRARVPGLIMIPMITFTGFHPDSIYLIHEGRHYSSAIGPLNSGIAAAAFAMGFDVERTLRLFNLFVYRSLGYFDELPKAIEFLKHVLAEAGMDFDREWARWTADGPFMHTINHPKVHVLAHLATFLAARAGLIGANRPVPRPSFDALTLNAIWPVYPELAKPMGMPGNYVFKRTAAADVARGRAGVCGLPEFVRESFALYAGYPREVFEIESVTRIRTMLESIAR